MSTIEETQVKDGRIRILGNKFFSDRRIKITDKHLIDPISGYDLTTSDTFRTVVTDDGGTMSIDITLPASSLVLLYVSGTGQVNSFFDPSTAYEFRTRADGVQVGRVVNGVSEFTTNSFCLYFPEVYSVGTHTFDLQFRTTVAGEEVQATNILFSVIILGVI